MSPETDQTSETGAKSGNKPNRNKMHDHLDRLGSALPDLAADTAACIRFFSRLPLDKVNTEDDPTAAPDFIRIARAAPLAGVAIALPAAGLGMVLGYTYLPPLV
ncbi:MAG: adenosylcobinamide-GDP ribazoletransferase, partial [Roseibium sp.]|nr:adenosylcobinamide-GDP ribazoletransferase [Roseibium sp.]